MNGKDIFLGLKYVGDDLIEKAEYGQFPTKAEKNEKKTNSRKQIRRPFLAAAIIAMMLLLVGCAVVYVLNMEKVKIGETTETVDYRLVEGTYVEDPHEVSQNVLTLAGLEGSKAYQACADYFAFKDEYTRNMEAMIENGTLPEGFFENNTYGEAMDAKAVELAKQYGLKPEGELLEFRTTRTMCDALGIERFVNESEEISANVSGGSCYDTGNFNLYFQFDFPEDRGYELLSTSGYLRWNRMDCFSREYVALAETGDWIERNYTTASGSEVLILQSPTQENGYILCDRGDALMSLSLTVNWEILSEENGVVSAEYQHMTDRQIELVADAIDFAVQPKIPTRADLENQAHVSQSATQNGWTITPKSVETDGYVARITIGVTAPEGTKIPTEGNIIFGNSGSELVPVEGEVDCGGGTIARLDDGDGLDNTFDLLLVRDYTMTDGSAPYADGSAWNLHLVDIEYSWWDAANNRLIDDILVEGEWMIPIRFDESNGNYREIEMLSQPISAKYCASYTMNGDDVIENIEEALISSVKVRSFSIEIVTEEENADFLYWRGTCACAVMKDGTQVEIMNNRFYEPIDLDQVDHVLLADGTKLMVPEN